MIEACDILLAFISTEDGCTGVTRFEIEYAIKLNIPIRIHKENGISWWIYQQILPFPEQKQAFFLSWQEFFCKTDLAVRRI